MYTADTPFRIDILDASGNRLGGGPLRNILSLNNTRSLDSIGSATFTMPAGDPRARHFDSGTLFDIYDEIDGYLGRYWFKSQSMEVRDGEPTITIECYDALRELTTKTVGLRRQYTYTDVGTVIESLVGVMGAGWEASSDSDIGNTTIRYEGESVLIAVDALRDRWGQHYRLASTEPGTNTLEFGAFGADCGVRAIQGTAAPSPEMESHREVAYIKQLRRIDDRADVFNTIIPLGAGEGTTQLTIEEADLGDYTTLTGTNADGSSYYYIQDEDSVDRYGAVWRITTIKQIAPLTNSDTDIRYAANALKLAAETYLKRWKGLNTHYSLTVQGLRKQILPGDKIAVRYEGIADNYAYIDVDESLWVMDVTYQRSLGGARTATLAVATDDARRTSDTDVMLDIMHDLNALKVYVPTTLAYRDIGPYTRWIDDSNTATFTVRIKSEVLALNHAVLSLRTSALKSSVQGTAAAASTVGSTSSGGGTTATSSSGGGTTATSAGGGDHHHTIFQHLGGSAPSTTAQTYNCRRPSGGLNYIDWIVLNCNPNRAASITTYEASGDHTHSITIADHTHDITIDPHTHDITIPSHNHVMQYGLYEDTVTPDTVRIAINGIDRTAALGGPWGAGGSNVSEDIDITTYIVNAAGGLRQDHTITVSCDSGRGEVEAGVNMLCSIQAIAVS
jgi:hypothetical protein